MTTDQESRGAQIMQDEVDKWMVGLGFRFITPKYVPSTASWRGNGVNITDEAATFFYQATQREVVEARIDEVKRSLYRGYYIPEMEVQAEDRINQLEQQRQKLREKRS